MVYNYNKLHEMLVTVARTLGPDLLQEVDDFDYAVQTAARGDRDRQMLIYERLKLVKDLAEEI